MSKEAVPRVAGGSLRLVVVDDRAVPGGSELETSGVLSPAFAKAAMVPQHGGASRCRERVGLRCLRCRASAPRRRRKQTILGALLSKFVLLAR